MTRSQVLSPDSLKVEKPGLNDIQFHGFIIVPNARANEVKGVLADWGIIPRSAPCKGNPSLLRDIKGCLHVSVTRETAQRYLAVTPRRVQQLMKAGTLATEGGGHNKRILVESLLGYLPSDAVKEIAN